MRVVEILPAAAAAGFIGFLAWRALAQGALPRGAWRWPAGAAALFLGWSLLAVVREGPLGFWPEHTRNLWSNQIWFDLLLAAAIAFAALVPRARAAGMRPLPWALAVLASGSVGLLAMAARLLYLEERRGKPG